MAPDIRGLESLLGAKVWRQTFYFVSTVLFAISIAVLAAGQVAERQAGKKLSRLTEMEIKREAKIHAFWISLGATGSLLIMLAGFLAGFHSSSRSVHQPGQKAPAFHCGRPVGGSNSGSRAPG